MRKLLLLTLILTLLNVPIAAAQDDNTIADTLIADENFSTLTDALITAELLETLDSDTTYTVFAPDNDAFAALPAGMMDGIMSSPPSRQAVLLFHVVEGEYTAADLAGMDSVMSVAGIPITISVDDEGNVILNDTAKIITADITAANGFIHEIDNVLVPQRPGSEGAPTGEGNGETLDNSIAAVIGASENFEFLDTTLSIAIYAAELLSHDGTYTLFAPDDDAFTALPAETRNAAIGDINLLTSILLYHTLTETIPVEDLRVLLDEEDSEVELETALPNATLILSADEDGNLLVNDAVITEEDIEASNGVIHAINAVLIPPDDAIIDVEALMQEMGGDQAETSMDEGPALDPNWGPVQGGFSMDELDTADDFFVTVIDPFTDEELYGVQIINWVAEYQYTGYIVEQFLPAEVLLWMGEHDPSTWENISDATLQHLPADVLAQLPEEVQARVQ